MHILPEAEAFRAQEDLHVRASRARTRVAILGFLAVAAWSSSSRSADYSNRVGLSLGGGAYQFVGGAVDHSTIGPFATFGVASGSYDNSTSKSAVAPATRSTTPRRSDCALPRRRSERCTTSHPTPS